MKKFFRHAVLSLMISFVLIGCEEVWHSIFSATEDEAIEAATLLTGISRNLLR